MMENTTFHNGAMVNISPVPSDGERRANEYSPVSSDPESQAQEYYQSSPGLRHQCFLWKSYEQQEGHRTGSRACGQADGLLCRVGTCRGGPAMSRWEEACCNWNMWSILIEEECFRYFHLLYVQARQRVERNGRARAREEERGDVA